MTAAEILRIAVTVGLVQLTCDVIANWRVFSKEPYQHAVGVLSRATFTLQQVQKSSSREGSTTSAAATAAEGAAARRQTSHRAEKRARKVKRARGDRADAAAAVARYHAVSAVATSAVFFVLLRIMGTDLRGKIVAVLPFAPFKLLRKVTARGLEFGGAGAATSLESEEADSGGKVGDAAQACSFIFIYLLSTVTVKHYVHLLVGTQPPPGADSPLSSLVAESPAQRRMLRSAVGIDADRFLKEE